MVKDAICSICNKTFSGYGNNPAPFTGEICCDECDNHYVIPLRLYALVRDPSYALHFKEDGTMKSLKPKNKYFTLKELQQAVGGLIELYPYRYMNMLIVCDEEGLLKEKRVNTIFEGLTSIKLVGDIVLCPETIFEEPDEEDS